MLALEPRSELGGKAGEVGHSRSSLPIVAAFPLAALVAFVSLVGILGHSSYARETPNWAAQGVGQDWADLLLAVPALAIAGWLALRGSRRALPVLAGVMLYTFYEFVIYGFAVHFNALFLAYCATLGVTFFSLAGLALRFARDGVNGWYPENPTIRTAGSFLIGVGSIFCLAWLGDIVPALLHGTLPQSIREAGVPTNPVYVIDLSIVLPLHVLAGVALLRQRMLGYVLAPVVLTFGVIMALSIAGMLLVMRQRGLDASLGVAASMLAVGSAGAVILARLLGGFRSRRASPLAPARANGAPPRGNAAPHA